MSQRQWIAWSLVGLPLGLIVLGIFWTIYLILNPEDQHQSRSDFASGKSVQREDLVNYVRAFAEQIGPRHLGGREEELEVAGNYVESTLGPRNAGYREVRRQTFSAAGARCDNLSVQLRGTRRANEIVIVGAHYDTVPDSPGANVNGSGMAALLALAQAFVNTKNERTLRFVAFVNREPPYFRTESMGSLVAAKESRRRREKIVAMLSLEGLGYYTHQNTSDHFPKGLAPYFPERANFIAFSGNEASGDLVHRAVALFSEAGDFPVQSSIFPPQTEGIGLSDHWSYWNAGYPAIVVTDTSPFRYPHHHQSSDTVDQIDFDRMLEVVRGLENVIRKLANPGR